MIIFLLLGAFLGGLSVIFVLQNIAPITVSFFAWQTTGSLAIILFLALAMGMIISLLVVLPTLIRDEYRMRQMIRRQKELEDELGVARRDLIESARATTVVTPPPAY
jgi:lipopolysaccharide assembly protein A